MLEGCCVVALAWYWPYYHVAWRLNCHVYEYDIHLTDNPVTQPKTRKFDRRFSTIWVDNEEVILMRLFNPMTQPLNHITMDTINYARLASGLAGVFSHAWPLHAKFITGRLYNHGYSCSTKMERRGTDKRGKPSYRQGQRDITKVEIRDRRTYRFT